jgi:ABC-type amino acid transport substrate-binding protein
MNPRHLATLAALAALALAGCGNTTTPEPATTVTIEADAMPATRVTVTATPAPEVAEIAEPVDPYEIYLEQNPDPDLILSAEDANTRAFLGCGTAWGEGTVDALLQEAYHPQC